MSARLSSLCLAVALAYGGALPAALAAGEGGKPQMSPEATEAKHKADVFGPDPT